MFFEIVVLLLLLVYLWNRRSQVLIDPKIPCPAPCYPIFGHLPHVLRLDKSVNEALQEFQVKWSRQFKEGLYAFHGAPNATVVLYKGEFIEPLLKDSTLIEKPFEYTLIGKWLGNGLLTSGGDTWRRHRKLLNPAFHSQILNGFLPTINAEAMRFVDTLKHFTTNDAFDVRPHLSNMALRIITATAMALPVDTLSNKYTEYLKNIRLVLQIVTQRIFSPHLRNETLFSLLPVGRKFARAVDYLHSFTFDAIRARKAERSKLSPGDQEKTNRKTFLDLILDCTKDGDVLTDREVREEVDTVMFAGHDTTSSALMWAILLIGRHSNVQEKIREELHFIFGDDKNRDITLEDVGQMRYIECVIKEVIRLFSPAPTVGRKTTRSFNLGKYSIPANCTLVLLLHIMHRDPDVFDAPNEFRPERFLEAGPDSKIYSSYAPFALGARNCIGQRFAMFELKVILARIFLTYKVTALDDMTTIKKSIETVMSPISPIRIQLNAV